MDAPPTPRPTLRLLVDITRTADGRLEGQLRTEAAEPWTSFSGVLELLKVLEDHLDHKPNALNGMAPIDGKKDHG